MDHKQIKIVLSVARNLSFSEAAYETHYSASVVSKQVALLENELGVRLFDRKSRSKVSLTEIGQRILPHLMLIQAECDQIKGIVGSHSARKVVKLICPRGFSGLGEDELISIFCAQNPDIEVRQLEGGPQECQNLLMNGDVDISVRMLTEAQIRDERFSSKNLVFTKLGENRIGVVLRSDHPAVYNGMVDLAKLRDETFFFRAFRDPQEEDPKVKLFQDACRSEGFEPSLQLHRDMRAWAAFALAAKGICVVPCMHAPAALYPGTSFIPLSKIYYSFIVGLLYHRNNPSLAVRKFVRCAQENAHVFSSENSST